MMANGGHSSTRHPQHNRELPNAVTFGGRIPGKMMSDDADIGQEIGSLGQQRQTGPHTNMWDGP